MAQFDMPTTYAPRAGEEKWYRYWEENKFFHPEVNEKHNENGQAGEEEGASSRKASAARSGLNPGSSTSARRWAWTPGAALHPSLTRCTG